MDTLDRCVPLAKIRTENYVSKWYLPNEIELLLEIIEPGDALEFSRGLYKHWGLYIGPAKIDVDFRNGVVHAFIPGEKFFLPSSNFRIVSRFGEPLDPNKGYVDCNELKDVMGASKVRINNSMDATKPPFDTIEIIDKAIKAIGFYQDFSILKNNCEHFVNIIRNGIGSSGQVDHFTWGVIGSSILTGLVSIGFALLRR